VPSNCPLLRLQSPKAPTGTAWARIVPPEFLDKLGVQADDTFATLDVSLARGNPRRRLLVDSKGRVGVVVAVHGCPPW
jgi:hypothetical protein